MTCTLTQWILLVLFRGFCLFLGLHSYWSFFKFVCSRGCFCCFWGSFWLSFYLGCDYWRILLISTCPEQSKYKFDDVKSEHKTSNDSETYQKHHHNCTERHQSEPIRKNIQ